MRWVGSLAGRKYYPEPMNRLYTIHMKAFTLIELLIVVAIVAVLSAIAVPNFLEAQTRAKVSRVRSDMRTLGMGLELYTTDHRIFPPVTNFMVPSLYGRLVPLTTPIAYMTSLPRDVFYNSSPEANHYNQLYPGEKKDVLIYNTGRASYGLGNDSGGAANLLRWSLTSLGPDRQLHWTYYAFPENQIVDPVTGQPGGYLRYVYDPSNGTTSRGEIFRRGGGSFAATPGLD